MALFGHLLADAWSDGLSNVQLMHLSYAWNEVGGAQVELRRRRRRGIYCRAQQGGIVLCCA